jgi:hypothetical protein
MDKAKKEKETAATRKVIQWTITEAQNNLQNTIYVRHVKSYYLQ